METSFVMCMLSICLHIVTWGYMVAYYDITLQKINGLIFNHNGLAKKANKEEKNEHK